MSCTNEDFIMSSRTLDNKNGYYEILFITKLATLGKNSLFSYLNCLFNPNSKFTDLKRSL